MFPGLEGSSVLETVSQLPQFRHKPRTNNAKPSQPPYWCCNSCSQRLLSHLVSLPGCTACSYTDIFSILHAPRLVY